MIVPFAAGGTSDVIARVVAEEMSQVARAADRDRECRRRRRLDRADAGRARGSPTATPSRSAMPAPVPRPIRSIRNCRSRRNPSRRSRSSRRPSASSRCARIFRRRTCRISSPTRRSNPGKVNLGHAGVGSSNFLICKSFVQAAGIDVTLVGYRGAAPALTDAIGGQIDGVCDAAASVSQADRRQAGAGAWWSARRCGLRRLPDLPTSAEAGLPEFEAQGWNGLFAPKGTPPAIIAKLNAAAKTAVESEAVKKRFHDLSTVRARRQRARARSAAANW